MSICLDMVSKVYLNYSPTQGNNVGRLTNVKGAPSIVTDQPFEDDNDIACIGHHNSSL